MRIYFEAPEEAALQGLVRHLEAAPAALRFRKLKALSDFSRVGAVRRHFLILLYHLQRVAQDEHATHQHAVAEKPQGVLGDGSHNNTPRWRIRNSELYKCNSERIQMR